MIRKPPFTIWEVLVQAFCPHDGSLYASKEESALLGMSPEGELLRYDVPEGEIDTEITEERLTELIAKYVK